MSVLLALQCCGCTTWRATDLAPEELISRETPREIRVTCHSRPESVVIRNPSITHGHLVGDAESQVIEDRARASVRVVRGKPERIPLSDIERLEILEVNRKPIIVGAIVIVAFGALAVTAATANIGCCSR